ncbi:MAG: hypothetical protein NTX69_03930, partial [Candidatus Bipolaricaulota bacterium]|nr:hypothetical protein [Candidatus Bipolaricaulota bacterium]
MGIAWSALGLGQFVAVAGDGSAFFREGAHVGEAAFLDDPTVLRVTYGEAVEHGIPNLDLSLLYRGLFPCEADHGLASACAACGIAYRSKTAAVAVGELLLCVVVEAATLDRGMLQLLGYLCGGAAQDVLLGLAALPIPAEPEEKGKATSRLPQAPEERGWIAEDDVLGPNGLIARQLPTHEVRRGQLDMAGAVAETLRLGGALCVEAGPGTGKTFAYLVPALV